MRKHNLMAVSALTVAALTAVSAVAVFGLAAPASSAAQIARQVPARLSAPAHRTTSLIGLPSTGMPRVEGKAEASNDCGYVNAVPMDNYQGLPNFTAARAAQPYSAKLYTTQGTITFQALTTAAPCTTYSFRFLALRGYFTGTHCHRLTILGIYVLQCGDPTGTGSGGPGYEFNDENLAGATYPAGTVAMANAGPHTNGSQFFICWKNSSYIPPDYTPFGVVTGGMNVLQTIASAGDDSQNGPGDGYPNLFVEFLKVAIVPGR